MTKPESQKTGIETRDPRARHREHGALLAGETEHPGRHDLRAATLLKGEADDAAAGDHDADLAHRATEAPGECGQRLRRCEPAAGADGERGEEQGKERVQFPARRRHDDEDDAADERQEEKESVVHGVG